MAEVINFEDRRSAGGVTDTSTTSTHEEEQKEYVADRLKLASELNLKEVIIIGMDGEFIHYLHSELGEQRLVYLTEKFKHFVLSGGMDED
jgi:hypothetical protein